jgi:hypothetical protein
MNTLETILFSRQTELPHVRSDWYSVIVVA